MPSKRKLPVAGTASKGKALRSTRRRKALPVTLLSGFLGSGKTTLLQHILKSDHGLRIAVIVNDIGEVNVDASLIQDTHRITKTEEKVIALQNGCICCTLRQDLLTELVELSDKHAFDYVIIESSGISEPAQVAESFDAKLSEHMYQTLKDQGELDPNGALKRLHEAGEAGLTKFARLDTTVTVIDAFTMHNDFHTIDLLSDRRNDVTPDGDERTVSDLMVDQIEFADVIILNKTDAVTPDALAQVKELVRALNREAKILCSSYGKVDVSEIVNTKLFSLEKAQTGAGWMQDLHELLIREINGKNVITPKPETEEYNVRNFVYKRRRPFHPERLWRLVYDKFILQLEHPDENNEGSEEPQNKPATASAKNASSDSFEVLDKGEWEDEDTDMDDEEAKTPTSTSSQHSDGNNTAMTSPMSTKHRRESTDTDMDVDDGELTTPPKEVVLQNKRGHPLLGRLFRSKGTFWLATRPDYRGIWSQAGAMLTLLGGSKWDCTLDAEELATLYPPSTSADIMKQVDHDIAGGGEWGDRRQEVVFIGEKLDREGIEMLLDECLVTNAEWSEWQRGMRKVKKFQGRFKAVMEALERAKEGLVEGFEDAFPEWEGHFEDEEYGDEQEDDEGHEHHHH